MAVNIMPYIVNQYFDDNGTPLSGGKLYTYVGGTSTPKTTYQDYLGTTPHTNPIILDSGGRTTVYLDTGSYKLVLTDSDDNTIWTEDNVSIAALVTDVDTVTDLRALAEGASTFVTTLGHSTANDGGGWHYLWDASSSAADDNGMVIRPDTLPANGRWIGLKPPNDQLNVRVYGAKCDGTTDDLSALQACDNYTSSNDYKIFIDNDLYSSADPVLSSKVVLSKSALFKFGATIQPTLDLEIAVDDLTQHFTNTVSYPPTLNMNIIQPEWFGETIASHPITSAVIDNNTSDGLLVTTLNVEDNIVTTGNITINDNGYIGITSDTDLLQLKSAEFIVNGKGHILKSSSGASADSSADTFIVEEDVSGGISVLTPDNQTGAYFIGSPSASVGAFFRYQQSVNLIDFGAVQAGGQVAFWSDGAAKMRLDDTGALGIGTTSPYSGSKLHVKSGSSGVGIPETSSDDFIIEGSTAAGISILTPDNVVSRFGFGSPSNPYGCFFNWLYNTPLFQLRTTVSNAAVEIKTGADTSAIYIDGNQRVGIGTTNPFSGSKLRVYAGASGATASTDANTLIVEHPLNGGLSILTPDVYASRLVFGSPSSPLGSYIYHGYSINRLIISTAYAGGTVTISSGNQNTAIYADSSQKVGIKTSTPKGSLHVYAGASGVSTPDSTADDLIVEYSGNGGISILTPDANRSTLGFGTNSLPLGAVIDYRHNSGLFTINAILTGCGMQFQTQSTNAMFIDSNQTVGIGTTSPLTGKGTKLHIYSGNSGCSFLGTYNSVVIEKDTSAYLVFATSDTGQSGIRFSNASYSEGGQILWNYSAFSSTLRIITDAPTSKIEFYSGGAITAQMDASQDVSIYNNLHIGNSGEMTISHNGTDGAIVTNNSAASDLVITCGTQKTIELANTVWNDVRIVPGAFDFGGANDPLLSDWQPGATGATYKVYKFDLNDEAFAFVQMPHTYKEGTDLEIHIHWTPCDRGNEESGNAVGWKVDYSVANVGSNFPSSTTADLSDTCSGVDNRHEITSSVTIDGTGLTISHMLVLRVYRSDTGSDDTWSGTGAQAPALLEVDIHHEIDTIGSRQESVK